MRELLCLAKGFDDNVTKGRRRLFSEGGDCTVPSLGEDDSDDARGVVFRGTNSTPCRCSFCSLEKLFGLNCRKPNNEDMIVLG